MHRLRPPSPFRGAGPLVPALLAAAALLAACGGDGAPPRPGAFVPPARPWAAVAFEVQQTRPAPPPGAVTLTLGGAAGSIDTTIAAATPVFVLRSATAATAAPGDWVTVVGVPNEVLNFAVRRVVIVPAVLAPDVDASGVPRLTSGIAGAEAGRDAGERPVLAGRVTRVDGSTLMLDVRGREVALDLSAGPDGARRAPVQVVERTTPGIIHEGDRIAYVPARRDAPPSEAAALLVLPAAP